MNRLPDDPRTLFEAIPDPAFLLDSAGVVLDVNAAATAQLPAVGPSPIGRRIQEVSPADAGERLAQALAQIAATGASQCVECSWSHEGRCTHHEARLVPLPGGEVLMLVRDITSRKQTEDSLRENDAKFRLLADNITDAFWIRTPDMRKVLYVSPAFERIWGRPTETLYSNPQSWADFIVPEDREQVVRVFAGLTAGSPSLDLEYRILRPDGEQRWVRVRGYQVRDAAGNLLCNTGVVTDTTERKLAQAELDAAHKQLLEASRRAGMAEVATNVLHDVGNILNSVTVSAGLVRGTLTRSRAQGLHLAVRMLDEHAGELARFLSQDDKGKMLPGYLRDVSQALLREQKDMMDELQRLTQNIHHVRDVINTQQSYGARNGGTETGRIGDLVEDALRINAHALEHDGIVVIRDFATLPPATFNRTRVLQILINLIGNARDSLARVPPEVRRITVSVGAAGDGSRVRVSVRDQGEGISAENLTRIFAHGFTTRKHGRGFGLHSCAQAAAQIGGALTVHSDGPGRGAVFTLELPLDPLEAAP